MIYTPWLGFNLFSIWKVEHKIYCSVNPTGTQTGKLRSIRGSANDSRYATRLPPATPVNVARESAPVSSACNNPMPVGVSRYPVSSACNPPMPVGVSRESAPCLLLATPPCLLLATLRCQLVFRVRVHSCLLPACPPRFLVVKTTLYNLRAL